MSGINYLTILAIQIIRRKNPDMLRVWECSGQQKVKPQFPLCISDPTISWITWQVNNVLQQPCRSKGDSQGWDRGSAAHSHGQGDIKRMVIDQNPNANVTCNKWACLWWILTLLVSTPGSKLSTFLLSRHVALGLWLQWSRMQEELKLLLVVER